MVYTIQTMPRDRWMTFWEVVIEHYENHGRKLDAITRCVLAICVKFIGSMHIITTSCFPARFITRSKIHTNIFLSHRAVSKKLAGGIFTYGQRQVHLASRVFKVMNTTFLIWHFSCSYKIYRVEKWNKQIHSELEVVYISWHPSLYTECNDSKV